MASVSSSSVRTKNVVQKSSRYFRDSFIPLLTLLVAVSFVLIWLGRTQATAENDSRRELSNRVVATAPSPQQIDITYALHRKGTSIVHHHEMMSLSVRAAIASQDIQWKARYDAYADAIARELETLVSSAESVSPSAATATISIQNKTADIQSLLREMIATERAVLDHAQAGDWQQAERLFNSERYLAQQELCARTVQQLFEDIERVLAVEHQQNTQQVTTLTTGLAQTAPLSLIGMMLLATTWTTALMRVKHDSYRRQTAEDRLEQNNAILSLRHRELKDSKAALIQRNNALEDALSELNTTKAKLEISHQHVHVSRAALSQKAATLESTVQALRSAKAELADSHREVQISRAALAQKATTLEETLDQLQQTQMQMIQSEKMSSLGQLVAGIAHEVNNPINFIYANIEPIREYTQELLTLVTTVRESCNSQTVIETIEDSDLAFIQVDLPKVLNSMEIGTERIRQIVLSLQNFSRSDEAGRKLTDIHEGLESSLLIAQHRLNAHDDYSAIEVIREYGELPKVDCYPGLVNQVFMNLLSNAIDALDEKCDREPVSMKERGSLTIRTREIEKDSQPWVEIDFVDAGIGIPDEIAPHIFNAFFTTKPVGKGTGIGLSVSYTIIEKKHQGELSFSSVPKQGSTFTVRLPVDVISASEPPALFMLQPPMSSVQIKGQAAEFVL